MIRLMIVQPRSWIAGYFLKKSSKKDWAGAGNCFFDITLMCFFIVFSLIRWETTPRRFIIGRMSTGDNVPDLHHALYMPTLDELQIFR